VTLAEQLARRWPQDARPTTLALSEVCWRCLQRHAVSTELDTQARGQARAELRRVACQRQAGWYWGG